MLINNALHIFRVSGPKRYRYADGEWLSTRDGTPLLGLLVDEIKSSCGVTIEL